MKRFLTTKTKTKTKLHSERLNENESSSSSSSPDKERMFVDLQEQALGNNDKSTTAFPTSNPSSSTIPQRSKSATAALRRMLSRSFSKKVPEDDETQRILEPGREQAEAEAKPQSCKGHTFSLSSLGSSACDRHLRECPRSEIGTFVR